MYRKFALLLATLALTACAPSPLPPDPPAQASDLTVDQVLARYVAARGGEQGLAAVQSVHMAGKLVFAGTSSIPLEVTIAPGRYLRRLSVSSGAVIKAVDGAESWEIGPQSGIFRPTEMVPEDAARYRHLADPQGALFNPQAKGNKVEVAGKLPWQGSEVYKLKVTFADGRTNHFYLDAKTFLLVRTVSTIYMPQIDREVDYEIVYKDFRDAGGVKWPFTETASAPQARIRQITNWEKIELNPALDQVAFKEPV
jgi:hypothetical protein